MVTLAEVTAVH